LRLMWYNFVQLEDILGLTKFCYRD